MPPPHNGNAPIPFAELMKLEKVDENTFRSIALPHCPGGRLPRAVGVTYGGHVFSQAAWAACQTVKDELLLYNITGSFILPGTPRLPFTYTVQRLRDGRSSCTRIVQVTQDPAAGVCFTCTIAFRKQETSAVDLSDKTSGEIWQNYSTVLSPTDKPSSFPRVLGMDVPWYWEYIRQGGHDETFPGLEMRQVDMSRYNDSRHPLDKRALMFYRPLGELLPQDEPNLHLCAHLYASDRNSLYIIANFMDLGDLYRQMGSLVHTVIFHSPGEEMLFRRSQDGDLGGSMEDSSGTGRWFCREDRTDRAGGGRLMFHSRIWDAKGGHCATIMQDGMTRFSAKAEATSEEVEALQERMKNWKTRGRL